MKPQRVLDANRITLPESFTKKWGMKPGDIVLVDEVGNNLVVMPADVRPKEKRHG